jgi:hypothetical protein
VHHRLILLPSISYCKHESVISLYSKKLPFAINYHKIKLTIISLKRALLFILEEIKRALYISTQKKKEHYIYKEHY